MVVHHGRCRDRSSCDLRLYRYRISRLLELEQVRTRIASDLHDDIGAGLSRLAILSEVRGMRPARRLLLNVLARLRKDRVNWSIR
jgi:signal transduction histidine kinase